MLVVAGQVRIQSGEMAAQHFCGGSRRRHDRGVNACCTCLRAYAYPSQRRILKTGFSPVTVRENPPDRAIVPCRVHGRKWFV